MRLKYIAFSYLGGSKPLYMIFPELLQHRDMEWKLKNQLAVALSCNEEDLKAVSAGFVNIHDCVTYDNSVSLRLDSKLEDAEILSGQKEGYGQRF